MDYLFSYLFFLFKALTIVVSILLIVAGIASLSRSRDNMSHKVTAKHLNHKFNRFGQDLRETIFSKAQLKKEKKAQKALEATLKEKNRKRIYYVQFNGDLQASDVASLREKITAILTIATPHDEVAINIDSPGGLVHTYGLCASQLARLRQRNIPLTVIIDKVAASGGYMMASVANKIIAAPFAIVGSIGVLVQLPNFHRLLKEHNIDFEQLSGGEYKRTLTYFGENTPKARQKMQEDVDHIHDLFKQFVETYRPQLDINKVATGEIWCGQDAIALNLIDQVGTSDDYLLESSKTADIYEIKYRIPQTLRQKLGLTIGKIFHKPTLLI